MKIVALTDAFQSRHRSLRPAVSNPANLNGSVFRPTRGFGEHFNVSILARWLLIIGLCLLVTGVLNAQTPDPSPLDAPQTGVRPPLIPFPMFEDWSFLRDPSLRVDPYDRLKFIPLDHSGTNYLTFGLFLAALNVAGFITGTFLQQSPPSNEIAFVNLGLTYRF